MASLGFDGLRDRGRSYKWSKSTVCAKLEPFGVVEGVVGGSAVSLAPSLLWE
jgi:hypothetical protein